MGRLLCNKSRMLVGAFLACAYVTPSYAAIDVAGVKVSDGFAGGVAVGASATAAAVGSGLLTPEQIQAVGKSASALSAQLTGSVQKTVSSISSAASASESAAEVAEEAESLDAL